MVHCRAYPITGGVAVEIYELTGSANGKSAGSRSLFNGIRNGLVLTVAQADMDQDVANQLIAIYEAVGMVLHDEFHIIASV